MSGIASPNSTSSNKTTQNTVPYGDMGSESGHSFCNIHSQHGAALASANTGTEPAHRLSRTPEKKAVAKKHLDSVDEKLCSSIAIAGRKRANTHQPTQTSLHEAVTGKKRTSSCPASPLSDRPYILPYGLTSISPEGTPRSNHEPFSPQSGFRSSFDVDISSNEIPISISTYEDANARTLADKLRAFWGEELTRAQSIALDLLVVGGASAVFALAYMQGSWNIKAPAGIEWGVMFLKMVAGTGIYFGQHGLNDLVKQDEKAIISALMSIIETSDDYLVGMIAGQQTEAAGRYLANNESPALMSAQILLTTYLIQTPISTVIDEINGRIGKYVLETICGLKDKTRSHKATGFLVNSILGMVVKAWGLNSIPGPGTKREHFNADSTGGIMSPLFNKVPGQGTGKTWPDHPYSNETITQFCPHNASHIDEQFICCVADAACAGTSGLLEGLWYAMDQSNHTALQPMADALKAYNKNFDEQWWTMYVVPAASLLLATVLFLYVYKQLVGGNNVLRSNLNALGTTPENVLKKLGMGLVGTGAAGLGIAAARPYF